MNNNTQLDKFSSVALMLNEKVANVIGEHGMQGFQKAYVIADAIGELKNMLTPEYMKPIMELQGNKLGFKTDKDATGGYPVETVKNCLIEAVLMGVQPYNNQFNIIAGNCYLTKEGCGFILNNTKGLTWQIIPTLPRIQEEKGAVIMKIKWSINGVENEQDIDFGVKVNKFMGADAVIGKATRKARAWLIGTLSGMEIPEGEAEDFSKQLNEFPEDMMPELIAQLEVGNYTNYNRAKKTHYYTEAQTERINNAMLKFETLK